jgi:tetratricopeptide (TPR) repeat protein
MSVKVANNRFIVSSLERCAKLYQQLFKNVSSFQELGNRLVKATETAQAFRQIEMVEELALLLSNFPLKEFRLIGQYYRGWCMYRSGREARGIFEEVLEKSETYKAKALMTIGALEAKTGNFESELKYFIEALKHSDSIATSIKILRGIAASKAKEGYHKHALKDLERIAPYFSYAYLQTPYDCWNSYAVELLEVGRIQEARNISNIVLASSYAFAYPEWRETGQDLALRGYKSRSTVSVIQRIPGNLLYLPKREASDTPILQTRAQIFSLEKWKEEKMVKEPNGDDEIDDIDVDKMSEQDMVLRLIEMLTTGKGDEKKIRKLLKAGLKIFSEK